ncbi:ATP-binding cassette domain-containing protein [Mesorhizobium sp. BH1-1-4]|uniref:ATP-binding cassette domain-containing protein n=1 Tax=Mesorhizobium sp. BH1-1-4 TaxID=2876662 RepID=UPI001CD13CC3|nr:ATP-binding cassette domain-containing protein [Mesorhizobium sp. BH1-1-4]MBZ9992804.1 ATP-binding cassette domain-containing protein [Mesorhizobium sp. BH1-1-4]
MSGIDLSLCRGDILGLLGANGSGKSTLLRAITDQIRPHGGTVAIDADLASVPERAKSGFGLAIDPSDLPAALLTGRQYLELVAERDGRAHLVMHHYEG